MASAISREAKTYPTPTIRIHSEDPAEIASLCQRYTAELMEWISNDKGAKPKRFDGTLRGLITLYRKSPDSPYRDLKPNSRAMYDESLDLLERTVGDRQLVRLNGGDFRRWYKKLREPAPAKTDDAPIGAERIRRAFKAMQLLRIAIKFGVTVDVPECTRLAIILAAMRFEAPGTRQAFVTFEQSKAIIEKAIEMGRPSIAIAQALQFELTLRQIDVIGIWAKAEQGSTAGIVARGRRWSGGLLWSEIDAAGILRKKTTKTGQDAVHDTNAYPLVAHVLALIPPDRRIGPVIKNETTGLPYRYRNFYQMWRAVATKAGVPLTVWNRDSRAGGVTEGTDAGADLEAMRHHANHSQIATTALYSRKTLEKTRGVAVMRLAARNKPQTGL
ncbi:site-specific integrase [Aureimonas sp. AU12]|uniref:site-specific integrase n=1 Tax=Aureimonas sp. AU12 TaxID=1638161 RepID=UPI001FCD4E1A|nr:site-specific integrase [Aureimonas sp. AU12]